MKLRIGAEQSTYVAIEPSKRSASQVAERMRLYRKRRRQGLRSVRILLPVKDIDYFTRVVLTERRAPKMRAIAPGEVRHRLAALGGAEKNQFSMPVKSSENIKLSR